MHQLTYIHKKHGLDFYRAFIHKDDCLKFYDTIRTFSPLNGRRIYSIGNGYTIQRYEVILTKEELTFLTIQLSSKSEFWNQDEIDNIDCSIESL